MKKNGGTMETPERDDGDVGSLVVIAGDIHKYIYRKRHKFRSIGVSRKEKNILFLSIKKILYS